MPANAKKPVRAKRAKKALRTCIEVVILVCLLWFFFVLAGRALCKIALDQIAELTNTKITTESVKFATNCSVRIKGLTIRPKHDAADEQAILEGERVDDAMLKAETVYARFGIGSLLSLQPRLEKIAVKGFVLDAQHDLETGRWNVAALRITALKAGTGGLPYISLERGKLKYSRVSRSQARVIAAAAVDGTLEPSAKEQEEGQPEPGYRFQITTAENASSRASVLRGVWERGRISIAGSISSADIPSLQTAWTIYVLAAELKYGRGGDYSAKVVMKDFNIKRIEWDEDFQRYEPLLFGSFRPVGALQRFLARFRPLGLMDIDLRAAGNLKQLNESTITGRLDCKDVSICDRKFPYLIDHIKGRIDFTEKRATLNNLCGEHGSVKLCFNGWTEGFGASWQYRIRVTSDNMALDSDLYSALSEKQKRLWEVSAPSPNSLAAIDLLHIRRPKTNKEVILTVKLLNAKAVYRHFPYPLKNLTGTLVIEAESVTFSDLVARRDGWQMNLEGKVTDCYGARPLYDVTVKVENIPLDLVLSRPMPGQDARRAGQDDGVQQRDYDDFFALLPNSLKKLLAEVQPEGKINVTVHLKTRDPNSGPDYNITVQCLDNSIDFKRFSYPLKDVTGSVNITKDAVTFRDITGTAADGVEIVPSASTINLDGKIVLVDDAFSSASFHVDGADIFFDERLRGALPEGIKTFYSKLGAAGRFDLLENIKISKADDGRKCIDFDGSVRFKNCSFSTWLRIAELNGVVKTRASYKTGEELPDVKVSVAADSLKVRGTPLANVQGDIYYQRRGRRWVMENLTAQCCGGRLLGKLQLEHPAVTPWQYLVQLCFDDIDVGTLFAKPKHRETSPAGYSAGKMQGSLGLAGQVGDGNWRLGRCRLMVTDLQLGELSPLAKLLYVLNLTEPKDFAFDRMFVDSYIRRNSLIFERFDLSSRALAFSGSGLMNLQNRNVDLLLTARGRRLADAEPSVLQSLPESLGHAVMRMEVTGNVYDPNVTTGALPVIRDTLQILGTKETE